MIVGRVRLAVTAGFLAISCVSVYGVLAAEPWERKAAEDFARRFAFEAPVEVPEVDGSWWQIARNPDLGILFH